MSEYRYEMAIHETARPTYMGHINARNQEDARKKLHEKYGSSYPFIRSLHKKIR